MILSASMEDVGVRVRVAVKRCCHNGHSRCRGRSFDYQGSVRNKASGWRRRKV